MATACTGKVLNWNSKNCDCDMCKSYDQKNIYRLREEGKISHKKFVLLDIWYGWWWYITGAIVGCSLLVLSKLIGWV